MLSVENLTVRFAERPLFDGISFRIAEGQRVALAGRNGQGKSTLFRVLMGEQAPEKGKIELDKGRRAGYLPQDIKPPETDRTVIEEVLEALSEVKKLEAEVERLTERMAEDPENEQVLEAYGRAQARFEALGGYDADARARTILDGLGFSQERMNGAMNKLSGGWLMRVQLARLLLENPDLLIPRTTSTSRRASGCSSTSRPSRAACCSPATTATSSTPWSRGSWSSRWAGSRSTTATTPTSRARRSSAASA
jgi:ATPase subunit of ABC transporter with duplicated ATPase domains